MGLTVYHPYPRRPESLTICKCLQKAALSPQLFKDPECWSGWNLNQQPPARQTGAYLTELTRRPEIPLGISALPSLGQDIDNGITSGVNLAFAFSSFFPFFVHTGSCIKAVD